MCARPSWRGPVGDGERRRGLAPTVEGMTSPTPAARPVCPSCRTRTPRLDRPGGLCHACASQPAPSGRPTGGVPVPPPVAAVVPWATSNRTYDPTRDLTPGVLDAAAIDYFTGGQCHALADAIHRETGWDLAIVKMPCDGDGDCPDCVEDPWAEIDYENPPEGWDDETPCPNGYAAHIAVITPDGRLLDATGLRTPEQMASAYRITGALDGATGADLWNDEDAPIGLERNAGEVGRWFGREVEGWQEPREDVADAFVDAALAAWYGRAD